MHLVASSFPILPALLTAITIALWAFSRLPEYLTALPVSYTHLTLPTILLV